MRRLPAYLLLGLVVWGCHPSLGEQDLLLRELDGYLEDREIYDRQKLDHIAQLKILDGRSFDGCLTLADAYFSFSFDSTQHYLLRAESIADSFADRQRQALVHIRMGRLYGMSGNFIDAYHQLFEKVDTTCLTEASMRDYLSALYSYSWTVAENSSTADDAVDYRALARQYGDRILALYGAGSPEGRTVLFDRCMDALDLSQADSLNLVQVQSSPPLSHDYAKYAYFRSVVMEYEGRPADRIRWLVASSEADVVNAVKDYASLTALAYLITDTDLNRSFRYLRQAQVDAITYGSNLRSWQIAQFFPAIQEAYEASQAKDRQRMRLIIILLIVISAALIFTIYHLVSQSVQLSTTRRELEGRNALLSETNARLQELNSELSSANRLKEEYIGLFFNMLSENIDRMVSHDNVVRNHLKQGQTDQALREVSGYGKKSADLEELHRTFDTIFLALFPTFIEDFNALLDDGGKTYPKAGDLLSTELRVFALIRLGIDDSTKIAAFLHYSLSTVYNYKVRIKNHSLVPRDSFEGAVKQIGLL